MSQVERQKSLNQSRHKTAIAVSIIMWSALLIGVLVFLGYSSCENTNERIIRCIQAGRSPIECREALEFQKR